MKAELNQLQNEVTAELLEDILPYWSRLVDSQYGGFFGQVDGRNRLTTESEKGGVLCARILWTYSAAYRVFKNPEFLKLAYQARNFLGDYFVDREHGGIYWMVDFTGNPTDTKKQIYAQAFAIYGLTEFARATDDQESLQLAVELFEIIERHSYDSNLGGYLEAFDRNWGELADLRLSDKDANEKKTMNTHLHVLEAYTNLYRIYQSDKLGERLQGLIENFLDIIIDRATGHFKLFFDESWDSKSSQISYGHDIEGSWLLWEAAEVLGNAQIMERVKPATIRLAEATLAEGVATDGSLYNERDGNHLDTDRHWWPQAEAVIGFLNAYQLTSDNDFLKASLASWNYIRESVIDHSSGEWFWSVDQDGIPNTVEDKVGPWKCPYHNGRMCMEIFERTSTKF